MEGKVNIVIPARNELPGLKDILPLLARLYPDYSVIIVNDGSNDGTEQLGQDGHVTMLHHPYAKGNGAAIKTGARAADADILVFMDADGQHRPEDIKNLLDKFDQGFDMVVGARNAASQASIGRLFANTFYNWFASRMVGQKVEDLTSGFRVVRAEYFRQFLYLLPNGFSYPATSTMAFFRSGYSVGYVPIETGKRSGNSHIRLVRDGLRFLLILFKVGTLYSPSRIFIPASALCFITGMSYYLYTYITMSRFTNMSALLFTTAIIIFFMGLISEQITSLMYSQGNKR